MTAKLENNVNQPRHPLRINVGFLLNQPIGTYRDIHFELPVLHLPPDLELTDFRGLVRLGCTPQGILAQGKFEGRIEAECVRCLDTFHEELHTDFKELFAFKNHPVSDSGLIIPDDGNIDFAPLVREYLVIELPINPLCKPDCKGLCIFCGENLNFTTCEHQK